MGLLRRIGLKGFASAARSLDMAPTVVTRATAELDAHHGARLLHRTTRSLALTDVGATYLEQALRVLADLRDADVQAGASSTQP
ncbi:MAG: LysR family transcriptional regulator, partial [Rhodoferax sp.]|nr:LysR family transcriptional regulator [Rhodoferax sp.]